jgi:peptidoglycan/xylan/chitin deacetylase (PgdA/CDA1 family)
MTAVSPLAVPVLMYHEIADASATPSRLAVTPEDFAEQLGYLREAGFNSVTAGELASNLAGEGGELPDRPVVLTFDDGYGDFYDNALPLLKQHGFNGTLFMTTGWAGLRDEHKRMLNWRELAEVAEAGIEVGGHTVEHPQLDQLPAERLHEELYASKALIEDKLSVAVPGLAYPFGYSNARVRQTAREAGYSYAYSVNNFLTTGGADQFALPRLTAQRSTTLEQFRTMVNGHDTLTLHRDRFLTRGYSVVRRARASVRVARGAVRGSAG